MIIIKYTDNEITALGHSGYAEPKKDIVCAIVSTAFKMSVGNIQNLIIYQVVMSAMLSLFNVPELEAIENIKVTTLTKKVLVYNLK